MIIWLESKGESKRHSKYDSQSHKTSFERLRKAKQRQRLRKMFHNCVTEVVFYRTATKNNSLTTVATPEKQRNCRVRERRKCWQNAKGGVCVLEVPHILIHVK